MPKSIHALGAALTVLATSLAGADRARAGTYVMRSCNVPGHASATIGPWQPLPAASMAVVDTCLSGGTIGFALPAVHRMASDARAVLRLARPSDGPRSTIGFLGLRLWLVARLTGAGSSLYVATTTRTAAGAIGQRVVRPPGADAVRAPLAMALDARGTEALQVELVCSGDASQDCLPDDGMPLAIHGMEVTLVEDVAPTASISGGTLLAAGPVSGVRSLRYLASDPESGIVSVEALIGDTVVGSRDLTARCAYADLTACPASDEGSLEVDTHDAPDGRYPLTLRVTDAAANQQVVRAPAFVQTANEDRASSAGAVDGNVRLAVRFAGSSRSTATVPYGRRVIVRGRLTTASRRGLGHAAIDVLERPARAGAREVAVGSVRTRADGTFSYALARHGPSRTVRLSSAPDAAGRVAAASRPLALRVRAASRLRVSLRGITVRFSGRVLSGPLPGRGKRVWLRGRAPGYAWAPFASVLTDRLGRFSGSYRLHAHRPGVELQFRVVVPAQRGYPYLGYRGPPLTRRVR
jgi:hypothetical protein